MELKDSPAETFAIYRSSAGSGKTYQLAVEFISLVLKDPNLFNKTLAVTFTNKATKEMKERILEFLMDLADSKNLDLRLRIKEKTNLPEAEIMANAKIVTGKILHQYSQFSISTIDAFFQRIVKSFARELGLLGNYKVELDQDTIKQDIIDQLIEGVGDDRDLTSWLVDFSFTKVDENKSWNIRPQIEKLANEVFKESFQQYQKDLESIEPKRFKQFLDSLSKIKNQMEGFMVSGAKKAKKLMESHGLAVDDFSGKGNGPAAYFDKIINKGNFDPLKKVPEACENPEKWYTKTSPKKQEIQEVLNAGLLEITTSLVHHYQTHLRQYTTAIEVFRNFYTYGILTKIIGKLSKYRHDHDVMLISDIAVFLKKIIADNEAPFIYEKTGAWYQHFLIDEFQDTSGFQWENFKPLIENGLSGHNKSLLVGDGKQSIYRWRGGDWNLILHQVENDLRATQPQIKYLDTNWRSARKIVEFNNDIFTRLPEILHQTFMASLDELSLSEDAKKPLKSMADNVKGLYQDAIQKVADKNLEPSKGCVEVRVQQKIEDTDWKENTLDQLPEVIERLQDAGLEAKDIAILVRKTDEGKKVLETLIKHKKSMDLDANYCFDAISNESLFLGNASVIRLLINAIQYSLNPDDRIAFAELCFNHHQVYKDKKGAEIHDLPTDKHDDLQFILDGDTLPEAFLASSQSLIRLPVYEMIERLIQVFNLNDEKNKGYLQAFQDVVLEYFAEENRNIHDFLIWWEDKGKRKSIQIPENVNAIRVMTIHKSKGLQFKSVLVPFCSWKLDHDTHKDNFLWCRSDEKPFDKIGFIPVKYSKSMEKSLFASEYFEEKIKAHIDNLNLLYVALTRAEEYLWINCPPPSNSLSTSGDLVRNVVEENPPESIMEQPEYVQYIIGTLDIPDEKKPQKSMIDIPSEYLSSDWTQKIALRKKGGPLFDEENPARTAINYGVLVHEVLAFIQNEKEADRIVERFYIEGRISNNERKELTKLLKELFEIPRIKDWFNTDWDVKTELPIILKNAPPKRPDRVLTHKKNAIVIDFKTGSEKPADRKQVTGYRNLLMEMGYKNIAAFLLYIGDNKIISID